MEPGKPENTTDMQSFTVDGVDLWIPDEIVFEEDLVRVELRGLLPWKKLLLVPTAQVPQTSCGD